MLVADGNVDAANMLSRLLQAAGHTTETVHDGVKAVQKIAAFKPDLTILDIGMPGLDGYQVAEQIRSMQGLERTKLVAPTGWGGNQDRTRSEQAGFNPHLTKPAGFGDLNALIARLLLPRTRSEKRQS